MEIETKKRKKAKARNLIIQGATLEEASQLSNLSIDIIKKMSSKERLQQKQLEYLKNLRNELKETILKNKMERMELNQKALQSVRQDILNNKVDRNTLEKIRLSEEIEQTILELDRIERLEKLELLKEKKGIKIEEQTGKFLDKLEEFLQ